MTSNLLICEICNDPILNKIELREIKVKLPNQITTTHTYHVLCYLLNLNQNGVIEQ